MMTARQHSVDYGNIDQVRRALTERLGAVISFADARSLEDIAYFCRAAIDLLDTSSSDPVSAKNLGFFEAMHEIVASTLRSEVSHAARKALKGKLRRGVLNRVYLMGLATPTDIAQSMNRSRQSIDRILIELADVDIVKHWPDVGAFSVGRQGARLLESPPWVSHVADATDALAAKLENSPVPLSDLVEAVTRCILLPPAGAHDLTVTLLRGWELLGIVRVDESGTVYSRCQVPPITAATSTIELIRNLLQHPLPFAQVRRHIRETVGLSDNAAETLTRLLVRELEECGLAKKRRQRLAATALLYEQVAKLIDAGFDSAGPIPGIGGDPEQVGAVLEQLEDRLAQTVEEAMVHGERKATDWPQLTATSLAFRDSR